MTNGKWTRAGAVVRVPIFFKVILANSAMALVVVLALLTIHDMRLTVMLIVAYFWQEKKRKRTGAKGHQDTVKGYMSGK